MADRVIAVDLDEAAQALKLISEYLNGDSFVCRIGVFGTDVGVTDDYYRRLTRLEDQFVALTKSLRERLQGQFDAMEFAVKSLVAADGQMSDDAKELLQQIEAMKAASQPTSERDAAAVSGR